MSLKLPARPNLEQLRKQAKELLRGYQEGEAAATDRFRSLASFSPSASFKLSDAQHVIARDYGFSSWPKLKQHVDSLTRILSPAEMLAAAVRDSDSAKTARLLQTHPELKAQINEPMAGYGYGMQALLAAVQRSDRNTIDILLGAGADINARSRSWSGGLGLLDECSPEMAPFLIERGAFLDVHSAARLGMFEKLEELVSTDPSVVGARGAGGQTPLHYASTVEIAKYLLDHGAEIDARDIRHESTPTQHMLRVLQARHYPRDRQQIARHLIARGSKTDILMAAALGDNQLVLEHLEAQPDCIRMRVTDAYFPKQDARSDGTIYIGMFGRGRTPHLIARDFSHEDIFRLLMERSPQEVKLAQACELGDADLFRTMLENRPNLVGTLSDDERRRLPDAAQNNNTNAVGLMLAAGWPVDARGEYGMAALAWAAWHGNAEMVREILRYHPQLELDDCDHGITALGSALHGSENGWHRDTGDYGATVEALLEAGAKAPRVTDDLEASAAVRDVLMEYEESSAP